MIHVSGRLGPDEYVQAIYLHHRPPQFLQKIFPVVMVGYLLGIVLYGVMHFSAIEITVLIFPLFITFLWRAVFLPEQGRSHFYRDVTLSYHYQFIMTAERLTIDSKLEACELSWSDFSFYKVSPFLTLLYRSESEFYVFPSRWFESSEDARFFRDRLHQVLGPPHW